MRRTTLAVLALTALGALLRFGTLDRQSFWLDELVTVSLLRLDLGRLLDAIPESEATPYVYYVLAWMWAQVFGLGEIGLRSLSALAGTATIPAAYAAGSALVSRRAGVVAAALVSVHPFLVWYSQEARAYGLLAFFGACSLAFFGRALREPSRGAWIGWAVASSLALATHYFALFPVAAEVAWLVLRSRDRRAAGLAALVPAAVLAAHLPLLLAQRGAGSAVAGTPLARRLAGVPKDLVVGYSFPAEIVGTLIAASLVVLGLVLLIRRALRVERRAALVPGAIALVTVLAPTALALAGADYLVVRNTIVAIVPAAVCLAAGYAASRIGLTASGALCALGLAIVLAVSLGEGYGRTDWRGAAGLLEVPAGSRAIVVTPYVSRQLWSPYLPGLEEPSSAAPLVEEIAVVGLATEGGFSGGPVEPPDPSAPPQAPPGFRVVDETRTPTYSYVLYRAVVPTAVSVEQLAALRLVDEQPGILLQPSRS